jgi:hypothetical protein
MSSPHVAQAAQAIKSHIEKKIADNGAYRVEGRGMLNGRAVVRRDGETVDDAETYAVIVPSAPTAGGDAVFLMAGGKEAYLGMVHQGGTSAFDVGIGQTVIDGDSQNTADNPSTSNVEPGSFVNAMQLVTTVPNGVYDVMVDGSFLGGHSAGDSVQFRVSCNGTAGNTRAKGVPSAGTTLLRAARRFLAVTVSGGTIGCVIEYRRGDALTGETASASAPAVAMMAVRRA